MITPDTAPGYPVLHSHPKLLRKYLYFKGLLSSNNFVLEEMTALERMIYEARSFTLEEVVARTQGIIARGCSLIEDVNALCGGRFPGLFEKLEIVGENALHALSRERAFDNPALVLPLDAITLDNLDEVGGKAANLGEIHNRVGLPTPAGFAVTASAAALFLRETGLIENLRRQLADMDVTDIAALEKVCATASARIMVAALPTALNAALAEKAREMIDRYGPKVRLAVRSSAVCEDSEASFAGQHATVLGATPETLARAWSAVVASAFTARAVFYRRKKGYSEQDVMMSVLVLTMIQAKSSGVLYTVDPNSSSGDDLILAATWGLGVSVVDGSSDVDSWRIRRKDRRVIARETAHKTEAYSLLAQGGIVSRPVPDNLRNTPSLTDDQVAILVDHALRLENHYGMPLDVEWALDHEDQIFILQARPLARTTGLEQPACPEFAPGHSPLLFGGQAASLGVASGLVYTMQSDHTLNDIPRGAILVAKQTSPTYVAAMGKVAGIITDVGSPTGHMASVAREFGIPTLVGVGRATHLLPHGAEITLDATNRVVYAGRVQEILSERKPVNLMKGSPVYKALQEALTHLTPLNLVDPLHTDFSVDGCRTLHDIIRFCHEEAMREMFDLSSDLTEAAPVRQLDAPFPFQVLLLDLGGGIDRDCPGRNVHFSEVRCLPLRALLEGLGQHPPAPGTGLTPHSNATIHAIIAHEYVNFSGRLGHHFATIDSYAGPLINDNYITFSFKGGAAEYEQRVRRAALLASVLRRIGFRVTVTADAIKAEIRKYDQSRFLDRLHTLGRLLAFARNLDHSLHDDADVSRYVNAFFAVPPHSTT